MRRPKFFDIVIVVLLQAKLGRYDNIQQRWPNGHSMADLRAAVAQYSRRVRGLRGESLAAHSLVQAGQQPQTRVEWMATENVVA